MKLVSVATLRALDQAAIAAGIPADVLMERAGTAAAEWAIDFCRERLHPSQCRGWTVLAGKGNNGGDAYVAARVLAARSKLPVTVYATDSPQSLSGAARQHACRLPSGIPVELCTELPAAALRAGSVIIDGLLGTGITGTPRPPFNRIIGQVNASGLPVIALDLPSGMDADTGLGDIVITADLTVTMALPKQGLLTPAGLARCGCLRCADLGFPPAAVAAAASCGEAIFAEDARKWLPRRRHDAHKNVFGHLLVAGGSRRYTGAPVLAGAAGLRTGCGLVTVAVPATVRPLIHSPLNALIFRALPDGGSGQLCAVAEDELAELLRQVQAVVFGPGAGADAGLVPALAAILHSSLPVVVDADGLRCLAQHPELLKRDAATLLTPHPGELRDLLNGFGLSELRDAERLRQAAALAARTQAVVVLKGQGTVVAAPDGRAAINTSGNSGLASAGTGDVLAGILGSLLAQGVNAWDAACLGVFVHGLAAELVPGGSRALTADDLIEHIGAAFQRLTPFA